MDFASDFANFLQKENISFSRDGFLFFFSNANIKIKLIETKNFKSFIREDGIIYLYEDRWSRATDAFRQRILAHLSIYRQIFARKCTIRHIDSPTATAFLNTHHSYGMAKAKYKYGMYEGDQLVAVSLFSSPRTIPRIIKGQEIKLRSYEWVRYASLSDCRISGGMSKMLSYFEKEIQPDEIMSYADLEWSQGEVYSRIGFEKAGVRAPVKFWIDKNTHERLRQSTPDSYEIENLGSLKFLKLLTNFAARISE